MIGRRSFVTAALAVRDGLDQVVVVENRAGAGGNVGAEYVARARPDGQTVLFGTSGPLAINKALYPDQTYDPTRDFAPVAPLGRIPNVLAVNPGVPARSVQEPPGCLRILADRVKTRWRGFRRGCAADRILA
jgi:tripartite-type tricarboxylate transporter receptor subunit TctC